MDYVLTNVHKDYEIKEKKRDIQKKIFSSVKEKSIISLLGPDVRYIKFIKNYGFQKIKFYENNPIVFLHQVNHIGKESGITLVLGDILENLQEDAFYDLDLCCTINKIEKYLPKIAKLKTFSLTLALRTVGKERTLGMLAKYFNNFEYFSYRDSNSAVMLTIFKK